MNPRFLPFVSNDTSISTVYRKLSEGGEGIPPNILLSILFMITLQGIEAVRKALNDVAHLDSWSDKYREVIVKNQTCAVSSDVCKILEELNSHYLDSTDWITVTHKEATSIELAFIISCTSSESVTSLGQLKDLSLLQNSDIFSLDLTEHSLFSEEGKDTFFASEYTLKAHVFYHLFINTEKTEPVRAFVYRST